MRQRLLSEEGKAKYKKRMFTIELIFGHLKFNLGYRDFLLRTLMKVRGEFFLMCIGHNLKKIFGHRPAMLPNQPIKPKNNLKLGSIDIWAKFLENFSDFWAWIFQPESFGVGVLGQPVET